MTPDAVIDRKPSSHARRVKRSRGVIRRLPRTVRLAIREERNPALRVKRLAKAEAHREQKRVRLEARKAARLAVRTMQSIDAAAAETFALAKLRRDARRRAA